MKPKLSDQARYRRRHRRLGLCEDCPRRARKGKRHCAKCAARAASKVKRLRVELNRTLSMLEAYRARL